ncbi:MAG: glycosyl transferase family 1 [Deltaproteobacteria bacterium]|nr:glycosyltransferase [Deltaproteobacteria bacterium]RLB31292.1 MAG: glycosyl transferase family 1 [Deltaproteobacteria bacterium]
MHGLEDYRRIVGDKVIGEIARKARALYGKHIVHINSTYQGGGVAEILNNLVPLMNDIGIDTGWRTLHGFPDFFEITKKFHNALQGESIHFTEQKKRLYYQANGDFATYTHIDHDCVIIHDPQPLPLIKFYKKRQPWIWRCHVDLSNPNEKLWEFLSSFMLRYDVVIVSNKNYLKKDLPVDQVIIYPAIDPLSSKNMDIPEGDIAKYLKKYGISTDKPLITQISRFDKWKDPGGVIKVFKLVKEKIDCRLVLCGNLATDDPEGIRMYARTEKEAQKLIENGDVVLVTDPAASNFIFINALQRKSSVIVQKSSKEGFGLVVTEALWKGTPVVASNIGGIPLQIKDGENGFLLDFEDTQGFADKIITVLKEPALAVEMGRKGHEHVKSKFLITRLLIDYLDLLADLAR